MSRRGSGVQTRFASHERMELIEAVKKQDLETVEVRRPLEAGSSTESGPSRGGLSGSRSVDPRCRRRTPDSALLGRSSPYVRRISGTFDAASRCSSVPVRTSSSVTRTLPCHLAECPDFSPPRSPAIAVSATFRSLPRSMDARAGCEMATTPSPLVSTLYRQRLPKPQSTLGPSLLFCVSGTGWVLGYPRGAHPRTPASPCTGLAPPRCTRRRGSAIAE